MAVPHQSVNFPDVLRPEWEEIFVEEYEQLPSKKDDFYGAPDTSDKDIMKWSEVGTLADFPAFGGSIEYQSQSQGYDTTATHIEFASGCQCERKLFDDDQWHVFNQRPAALGAAAARTREKHAARILNNAFTNDTYFYNNTEGVSLCNNAHTTTSGASTANGFDNLLTASMTAVGVATGRIQMVGFRGDQAERISVIPDQLWYPPDLYEHAYEIISAAGKVDTANNNPNVHQGKYTGHEWNYLTDTNNWFMIDSRTKNRMFHWVDRIALEYGMIEDFDTLVAKFRAYMRYSNAWTDWRCILGFQVS